MAFSNSPYKVSEIRADHPNHLALSFYTKDPTLEWNWLLERIHVLPLLPAADTGRRAMPRKKVLLLNSEYTTARNKRREDIRRAEKIINTLPDDSPSRGEHFLALALLFDSSYKLTGSPRDLRDAIRWAKEGVAATPEEHPDRGKHLHELGLLISSRWHKKKSKDDMEEISRCTRGAIKATPRNHPNWGKYRIDLSWFFISDFEITNPQAPMQKLIRSAMEVARATPDSDPNRAERLREVAMWFFIKYEETKTEGELQEAIRWAHEAVAAAPDDNPDRGRFTGLARVLSYMSLARKSEAKTLRESIRCATESQPDDPNQGQRMQDIALVFGSKYWQTKGQGDLQEAIHWTKKAVKATHGDDPNHAKRLNDLAIYFTARYDHTKAPGDLREAISWAKEAAAATPDENSDRGKLLHVLAECFSSKYDYTAVQGDLEDAILCAREAVIEISGENPNRGEYLHELARLFACRYRDTKTPGDLEEAIRCNTEAVAATPTNNWNRGLYLIDLSLRIWSRFDQSRELDDLQEAISKAADAVQATPDDHPKRGPYLLTLGQMLVSRYEETRCFDDLEEAIAVQRQGLALINDDDPDRGSFVRQLCLSVWSRYYRTGMSEHLEESVRLGNETIATCDKNDPNRGKCLTQMGNWECYRYNETGELEHLQAAIKWDAEAVESAPRSGEIRALCLNNQGLRLYARFQKLATTRDLEKAIHCAREALSAVMQDSRIRGQINRSLGCYLKSKSRSNDVPAAKQYDYRSQAVGFFEADSASLDQLPVHRRRSLLHAGHLLVEDSRWERAFVHFKSAIQLLPKPLQSSKRHSVVEELRGLSSLIASLSLQAGHTAFTALRYLELGCGVISSQIFDSRNDVSDLDHRNLMLCLKYQYLTNMLDSPTHDHSSSDFNRRSNLLAQLERVAQEIRLVERLEGLQLPPWSHDLGSLAKLGPIIAFNITGARSDAIIITNTGIKSIPLPKLNYSEVEANARLITEDLTKGTLGTTHERSEKMKVILLWLWSSAVKPVLTELELIPSNREPLPCVWWVTDGPMAQMPIHAAGDYFKDSSDHTFQHVVSSYTPTIEALAYAREASSKASKQPNKRVLLVGIATTPANDTLGNIPGFQKQPKDIEEIIFACATMRRPKNPSKYSVLNALPDSDPEQDSSSSRFYLLYDRDNDMVEPLTIRGISDVEAPNAVVVYLSGEHLLHEAIHLTREFQLAGFPHVIGTLWTGGEGLAAVVAQIFYRNLFSLLEEGVLENAVARAFHSAIVSLWEKERNNPLSWTPFIHVGA